MEDQDNELSLILNALDVFLSLQKEDILAYPTLNKDNVYQIYNLFSEAIETLYPEKVLSPAFYVELLLLLLNPSNYSDKDILDGSLSKLVDMSRDIIYLLDNSIKAEDISNETIHEELISIKTKLLDVLQDKDEENNSLLDMLVESDELDDLELSDLFYNLPSTNFFSNFEDLEEPQRSIDF